MKKILAVDDDPTVLEALRRVLVPAGYDVVALGSGQEALSWLAVETADLALLDVNMPGLSGYDVCRRIRQDPRTAALPVIFLTAMGTIQDMVEGELAGSDLYLVKPVLAAKLLTMVSLFLSDSPLAKRPRPSAT